MFGKRAARSALVQRIATELVEAEQLHELIESRQRPTAEPATRPAAELAAPCGAVEEMVAAIWSEVLGIEPLGAEDDFFRLGGQSLLATRMLSRVADAFRVEVSLRMLFEAPTVRALARRIEAALASGGGAQPEPIVAVSRAGELPLSFAQQRFWFLDQLDPGSASYNVPLRLRLHGPLDAVALARSLDEIAGRHEVLRTRFEMRGGRPVQVIEPPRPRPLPRVDLGALPAAGRQEAASRLADAETARPFDLAAGPLLRAVLFRLGEEDHLLQVTTHHIVFDGSADLYLRELAALYGAFAAALPSPLARPALQYADFASWQRRWLQGEVLAARLAHWTRRLAGELPVLELPHDRPRPAVQTRRGGRRRLALDRAAAERLHGLARRTGATLFMAGLALFKAQLHRYTGQRDLVVGSPVADRPRPETEALIGSFVNTLVLRTAVDGEQGLAQWTERVRETVLDAFAHRDLPFELLVEALQPERDLSRSPLFQVMFVLQSAAARGRLPELPGLTVGYPEPDRRTARFDLLFTLWQEGDGFGGSIEYSADLFEAVSVDRMLGHFRNLLAGAAVHPTVPVAELPLLAAAERHQLLYEWNEAGESEACGAASERSIHQLFERWARRTPGAVAVASAEGSCSYGELNRWANRLARHLRRLGVEPGVPVAVFLDRSPGTVAALLAVLKAGGAYVPLEDAYPDARLAAILAAVDVRHAVTDALRGARLAALDAPLAHLVHLERTEAWESLPGDDLPPLGDAGDLAYVIFTSGSTGTPKGVMVRHRPVVNLIEWVNETFGIGPADRVLFVTSLCFDLSVYDVFGLLAAGGSIRVASAAELADPETLVELLGDGAVTFWDSAPAALQRLAPLFPATAAAGERSASRLRLVFLSGDWIPLPLPDQVRAAFPGASVVSLGGATEATVWSNWFPVGAVDPRWPSIPYGRPIQGCRYHVLDGRLEPCPVGVAGDLFIGGVCLSTGYVGDAALTAWKYLPDRFGAALGDRLYRTGDRARYGADGNLEFLGRLDHQVKVRGFRIELGEIEAALARHPAVRETVVAAEPTGEGGRADRQLVAYLILAAEAPSAEELRAFLRQRLPDYMVPAVFVPLAAWPLTANGKLDRRALSASCRAHRDAAEASVAPRDETERLLAGIWARVLGRPDVGVHDNFFEIGGDSILAIQIVAKAQGAGLRITPRQLFQCQTVAELAVAAGAAQPRAARWRRPADGLVPLTPIQHWFFAQDLADPHHFNQAVGLDVERLPRLLERALAAVAAHHDALRLRFRRVADGWEQTHAAAPRVSWTELDLAGLPASSVDRALADAASAAQGSLDLGEREKGALARFLYADRGEDRPARLLLVIHHLAVDGVSWRLLLEDLETACRSLQIGEDVVLPAASSSFEDWAEHLAAYVREPALASELDFWRTLPEHGGRLPVDEEGAEDVAGAAAVVQLALSVGETERLLAELPRRTGTRLHEALVAALAAALHRWTGEPAVWLDLEAHGREETGGDLDLTRTVGWFTSLYPVRVVVDGTATPARRALAVRQALRAVPGGGLSFGLLRHLHPQGSELAALPPAEVVLNYLGRLDEVLPAGSYLRPAAEQPGPLRSPRQRRRHLLEVNAGVVGGRLSLSWTHGARHHRATIERLAGDCAAELRALLADLDATPESTAPVVPVAADFPLAGLDPRSLERLLELQPGIEDVYPLTPAQQGMLFHTLLAGGSGVYVGQLSCVIREALDAGVFVRAWESLVERHTVLRTAFVTEDLPEPLQVVCHRAVLGWTLEDWRDLPAAAVDERLAAYLEEDRRRGFDLGEPPLLRLGLFRTAGDLHRLVLSYHHLILDGWSLPVLLRELLASYRRLRAGQSVELPAPRPYRDAIERLLRRDRAGAEAFWRGELAGFTAPAPLPLERPAEHAAAAGYGERRRLLPDTATAALRALARRHRLTLNTLVQGAWALLLAGYSAADDVVYGVVSSGRPADLSGVGEMVGMFINTLPARVRLAPDRELISWLAELQERQVEVRQHEHASLLEVQGWSEVPRGVPLFDSILVYENYPVGEAIGGTDGSFALHQVTSLEQTHYPLALLAAAEGRLALRAVFDRRLFGAPAVERLLGHLESLLTGMAARAESGVRLADLELLEASERHRLLSEHADTAVDHGRTGVSLHQMVAEQVARTPDAVALVFADACLSYRELDRRAERLARRLGDLGVGPGTPVGVFAERSLELVVGLLAVLRAGGAYLPVEPGHPLERSAFMLAEAAPPALLVQRHLLAKLPAHGAALLLLDGPDEPVAAGAARPVPRPADPLDLAYVIYTSGSTGRPKGAMNTHAAIVNRLLWMQDAHRLGAADRVLQKTPFSFDVSVWELFWPLLAGVTLVVARPGGHQDADYLAGLIESAEITVLHFVPAMLSAFLEGPGIERCRSLRLVVASGEALPAPLAERLLARSSARLENLYGPTEAAVDVTSWTCRREASTGVPIGRPIANTRVHLLDPHLRPVPAGIPGELHIGGVALARGYLARPALTAEKFIPDPFAALYGEAGTRLYKSGDLARLLADGSVEFLGRIDHQVKIRGVRIELGEVEAVLLRHPEVRESVVLAQDAPGGARLVAYVVADEGCRPAAEELRLWLRARLPEAMVPAAIVELAEMPLNANGKVDRRRLLAPASRAAAPASAKAPRTPEEEILAGLFAELLGLPAVGVDDDFFALGGHSLSATLLVGRVRRSLGVEIPLAAVFESPTVAALARRVEREGRAVTPQVTAVPRNGSLPLSFAQQRLWFHDQIDPGGWAFNIPLAAELAGDLAVPALERSAAEIVRRHEVLRTTFPTVAGQAFQVIAPAGPVALTLIDLSALPPAVGETAATALSSGEARRPFDLAAGPLCRFVLLRLAAREHRLLATFHHIVADGWSLALLLREMGEVYRGCRSGEPARLPDLPVQYADFAVWQRQRLQGEVLASSLDYWRGRLAGAPPLLELPADFPRPEVQTFQGARLSRLVPAELRQGLESLARREGATLFMVLMAAFQALLRCWTGRDDLVVGTDVANRNQAETEGLIGFFVNQLVLRTDASGDPAFRQLLARVRCGALEAYGHQDLPFDRLVDALQPERSLRHAPLFQVKLNFHDIPVAELELPDVVLRPLPPPVAPAQLDLILNLTRAAGGLRISAEYSAELFLATTIERLLARYETVLLRVVADPEIRLSDLAEALADGDRQRREAGWRERRETRQDRLKTIQRRAVALS